MQLEGAKMCIFMSGIPHTICAVCNVYVSVKHYRVFQKDLNIFYSGHQGHRTWHPVMFSYGDTLKTMPTNHKLQDRIRAAVQTIEGEQVS